MTQTVNATHHLSARGLTLVELLMVIAVTGVLFGLAATGWAGYRDRVHNKTAVDHVISISVVLDSYIADTGAPPASLAAIGRAGLKDPWGNPYQYADLTTMKGKGKARKDHSLVPLNSDYDL